MQLSSRAFLSGLVALALPVAGHAQTTTAAPASAALAETTALPAPAADAPSHPAFLRMGVGRTEAAGPTYHCLRVAVEYTRLLCRHWGASGRLVGIGGQPQEGMASQLPNQNYRAGYAEAEALWYPFGNARRVLFAVGAGGFAGYYQHNGYSFVGNYAEAPYLRYSLATWQGAHAGLLGSLNLEVGLGTTQRWRVGGKVMKETGLGGVTAFTSHSLTLARRF
ncbi:hypothetical protein [Hymenobacter convexus]|uniref:hypothetical protein n=1 Tax=Hymenobacter sp. CA1UV-4 TaxID=3063782 RepID=UPI00271445B4|nr:hypothetical protein [Hymenobacter sp. CA1UV-4]MDO7853136.1 hypothetical protein [Hymenobacter sp. CA1UV-4]